MKALINSFQDQTTTWNVRIVLTGQPYGRDFCLRNDGEPMVEFYDYRYDQDVLGQFVSRYYIKTFMGIESGLCLDGGVESWVATPKVVKEVQAWAEEVL